MQDNRFKCCEKASWHETICEDCMQELKDFNEQYKIEIEQNLQRTMKNRILQVQKVAVTTINNQII